MISHNQKPVVEKEGVVAHGKNRVVMFALPVFLTAIIAFMTVRLHVFLFEHFFHTYPSGSDKVMVAVLVTAVFGLPVGIRVSSIIRKVFSVTKY